LSSFRAGERDKQYLRAEASPPRSSDAPPDDEGRHLAEIARGAVDHGVASLVAIELHSVSRAGAPGELGRREPDEAKELLARLVVAGAARACARGCPRDGPKPGFTRRASR